MTDIVTRLRSWVHTVKAVPASDLMDEAADEIERLRRQVSLQQNLTLTDEEREAIAEAAGAYNDNDDDEECARIAATLHGLLKRMEVRS